MEYKEIITGSKAKDLLLEGIEDLAEAVLATMGPDGRTVIIQDMYGKPYVTKDGVSVANAISFKDPIKNIAATLIKEVAQKTADEAGDGTTTSICLAQSLIRHGLDCLSDDEVTIIQLQRAIDDIVADTLKELKNHSRKLSKKNINKVATISANNAKDIGTLIQGAYNHSINVKVEEGKHREDKVELVNGMSHDITYISNSFVNDEKRKEFNVEGARVIVCSYVVGDLQPFEAILQHSAERNEPVVFFVEDMTEACVKTLERFIHRGLLSVCAIKAPGFGQYRKDHLKDLASFTEATLLTEHWPNVPGSITGKAKRIVASKLNTIITKIDTIDLSEKIKDLETQRKEAKLNDYDRGFVTDRINNLTGGMAVISVGGNSEVEMRERKDRIEDAVLAVRSALEEGIVEGGGKALVMTYNKLINTEKANKDSLYATLLNILLSPSFQIFMNSDGRINDNYDEDRFKSGIVDPFKVTRCALENAASVAKTILSTEAVVLNEELWK